MELLPFVRGLLARLDPNVPITGETRLSRLTALSVLPVTIASVLVGGIGVLTLLLATSSPSSAIDGGAVSGGA